MSTDGVGPDRTAGAHRRAADPRDGRAAARGTGARLRLRNWRVRTKLGAVVVIPTVAFLVVGGSQTVATINSARTIDHFAQRVTQARQVTALVHELQRERDRSAGYIAAVANGTPATQVDMITTSLTADRRAVDRAARNLHKAIRAHPDVVRRTGPGDRHLMSLLPTLADLRAAVTGRSLRRRAVFDEYSQIIAAALALLPTGEGTRSGARNGTGELAFAQLAQVEELDSRIRGSLYAITYDRGFDYGEFQNLADLRAQRSLALQHFHTTATSAERSRYQNIVTGQAVLAETRFEQAAVARAQSRDLSIDPEQWWAASTTKLELERTAERSLLAAAIERTGALDSQARRHAALAITGIAAILVIALVIMVMIGRAIARALLRLRAQALEVAHYRLPDAIRQLRTGSTGTPSADVTPTTVGSLDEVGEVAAAFDAVHREAVRLAVEQAVLRRNVGATFVNLARRSQLLVGRQLKLIDSLEEPEQDPDQLATLFKIDHLATRMRRNDENLLVLSGIEPSRKWPRPAPVSQILLAAASEIEDYPRVRYEVADDAEVVGHAVPDLVHLLAELMENAATLSPPSAPVRVSSRTIRGRGELLLAVEDSGIGMADQALEAANRTLNLATSLDVSASERMGLYVVSRLATRHSIRVELRPAGSGGIIAYVHVPRALLAPPARHRADPDQPPTPGILSGTAPPPRPTRILRTGSGAWRAGPPPVGAMSGRIVVATRQQSPAAADRTTRLNRAGLPIRSPGTPSLRPGLLRRAGRANGRVRLDPDSARGTLSALYSGIGRAESDEHEVGQ